MGNFTHLVRFLALDGRTYYGDAIMPQGTTDMSLAKQANVITGDIFGRYDVTDHVAGIRTLLSPLHPDHVGSVRLLGLNYASHAKETNTTIPQYPMLFYKPPEALTGPTDPITVAPVAQIDGLDYECEMIAVIGKRCVDVTEAEALDCVLGYAVGNDVSHRIWQVVRGGNPPQFSFGKGFDSFAPYGPGIVSKEVIPDPQALRIGTRVNGVVVQNSTTAEMIFDIKKTIAFLSQGTTLMPGDLIWTATPAGVGWVRTPPLWLKHNDTVEIWLEGVGTITNKVEYQPNKTAGH